MKNGKNRKSGRRRHYNGRIALFAIMIAFSILAIIEIAYGQIKAKAENGQAAVEEEQEITLSAVPEKEQENTAHTDNRKETQDYTFMNVVEKKTQEDAGEKENTDAKEEENADAGQDDAETEEREMQIVFLGDSILDHVREVDGVATLIEESCNANVYNLSMGGTTAALEPDSRYDYGHWDSRCLLGVVNAIVGNIGTDIFDGYTAGEVMKRCDFSKTDYFVIEYGINDFLAQVPISQYRSNGEIRDVDADHTYAGALDTAVTLLHGAFPDAKIILAAPHFCQFFNGETFVGDCYTLDYGYGPLISYVRVCGYVAGQHKEEGVIFYNAMEEGGINVYNAEECLKDGIHMTSAGRRAYVEYLIRLIKADFYPEE